VACDVVPRLTPPPMSAPNGFCSAKRCARGRRDVNVDFATGLRQRSSVNRMSYALAGVTETRGETAAGQSFTRARRLALAALTLWTLGCGVAALGGGDGGTWIARRRHTTARPFGELAVDIERAFAGDERASVHRGDSRVRVVLDRDAQLEVRDRGDRVLLIGTVVLGGGPSRSVVVKQWMDVVAALPGVGRRTNAEE